MSALASSRKEKSSKSRICKVHNYLIVHQSEVMQVKDSPLFHKLPNGDIECVCCAQHCVIPEGKLGKCRARANLRGEPYIPNWGRYTVAIDPIEKKPLHHFLPGSSVYSYGTVGCNFNCQFCQNSSLSMWKLDIEDVSCLKENDVGRLRKLTPEKVVKDALANHCLSIASTYNEPTVTTEFSHDVFKLAKEKGLYTVYVTNGYESVECLDYLGPYLDAVNIDLKSFSDKFYRTICGGHLQPVCDTIKRCYAMGIHTEVTTLVIPQNNDSDEEFTAAAEFIASVSKDIPWHLSAYHDDYKFEGLGHTPLRTLQRAAEIGRRAGLKYIYLGNVNAPESRVTKCPSCGKILVDRVWFGAEVKIKNGRCSCGEVVPGLFEDADNRRPHLSAVPDELRGVKTAPTAVRSLPDDIVVFASQNGTAKQIAERIAEKLNFLAVDAKETTAAEIAECQRVVFVLATYGRGGAPAGYDTFAAAINEIKEFGAQFAIVGCGSSNFPRSFVGFAKTVEKAIARAGGREIAPLCAHDEEEGEAALAAVDRWVDGLQFA